MREVIQIADTLKVAVFHFLTRSYATRINVLSDSSDKNHISIRLLYSSGNPLVGAGLSAPKCGQARAYGKGSSEFACLDSLSISS